MGFTDATSINFFESGTGMAIPTKTRLQLAVEGITLVEDLAEFEEETLREVAANLRKPSGRIQDPNDASSMITTPTYQLGAKSLMKLIVAADAVRYYNTISRDITSDNMEYTTCLTIFKEDWKALKDRKKDETATLPKVSKNFSVVRWSEAFKDFLSRTVGRRNIPLSYVVRDNESVTNPAPPLLEDKPYSQEHGSVEGELVARASHSHPLFRSDSADVYYHLEAATRNSEVAASLKPFQRKKDGRAAYLAVLSQYAGEDKWAAELKKYDNFVHTAKWKGTGNYTLDKFLSRHRHAFFTMSQCSEHVSFQMPNEFTRVSYVFDALQSDYAPLQAAMAAVRTDTGKDGKRSDFEKTASYLLPHDPVKKRIDNSNRKSAGEISGAEANVGSLKAGIGKTGVHLRYHTPDEYSKLNKKQRFELSKYRSSQKGKLPGDPASFKQAKVNVKRKSKQEQQKTVKKMRKMVSSILAEQQKQESKDQEDASDLKKYILSVVQAEKKPGTSPPSVVSATVSSTDNAPNLSGILKQTKKLQLGK